MSPLIIALTEVGCLVLLVAMDPILCFRLKIAAVLVEMEAIAWNRRLGPMKNYVQLVAMEDHRD